MVVYSAVAQDLIILRDGNIIEARITEISQTEIRYKRFDHLDGPTVVIPAAQVLSIRYENGRSEIITAVSVVRENMLTNTVVKQENARAERIRTIWERDTAIDPDKFIFGFNVSPVGVAPLMSGPMVNLEFGKGNFNSEINLILPGVNRLGGGFLATFNYFWHSRIGDGYIGGGIGFSTYKNGGDMHLFWNPTMIFSLPFGINGGYKFVTRSGVYFRTGGFLGYEFFSTYYEYQNMPVYFKPDVAIGWTMR